MTDEEVLNLVDPTLRRHGQWWRRSPGPWNRKNEIVHYTVVRRLVEQGLVEYGNKSRSFIVRSR